MTPSLSMGKPRRWIYGWQQFFRAYRMARGKKRGAGKMPIGNALKMGAAFRFLVDGQFYMPPRFPRYIPNKTEHHQTGDRR